MSDLKTATSATPKVLVAQQLPSTEAAQYTAAAGTTVKITSARLVNTDSVSRVVSVSIVKTGGAGGAANRILTGVTITAGSSLDLPEFWLGPGDFITGVADVASKVALVVTGTVFSSPGSVGASGVFFDALGQGARSTSSTTVAPTITVGTGPNRYLAVAFMTSHTNWRQWNLYTTLTVSSSVDGALTRLVSADGGPSGQRAGSIHLFGRANPTSGAHTITCTLTDAVVGTPSQLVAIPISYSGVASTSGAVSQDEGGSSALSLTVTSAATNVPLFAGLFADSMFPIQNFNRQPRYFNGAPIAGTDVDYMMLADYPGATSVAFTSSNSGLHAEVGINLVAA